MFEIGDYVRIKEGTTFVETDDIFENAGGKIIDTGPDHNNCRINFDAVTLESLSDAYLKNCLEKGNEPYQYILYKTDLEVTERRDTDLAYSKATDKTEKRLNELNPEESYEVLHRKWDNWIRGFEQSNFFNALHEDQQRSASFTVYTFFDYTNEYLGIAPRDWTDGSLKEICLEVIPRKVTGDIELFENYGDVLYQFLRYFETTNVISSTSGLQKCLLKIKDKIAVNANDPYRWGMAKTTLMNAKRNGVDLSDQGKLNAYVENYNKGIKHFGEHRPTVKKIGRNDRVTVKFTNGNILEGVKFKKVEEDLKQGRCELVK